MAYLGHKSDDGRTQTVQEHLYATAALCAEFAAVFGAREQGKLVGLAHDLGKYSDAFQHRLTGDPSPVDHATAGAYECFCLGQLAAAFAVSGHHGGLPDGGGQADTPDRPTFWGRINRAKQGKLAPYDAWKREISLPSAAAPVFYNQADAMFFTRMLYSCLTDADFLDTEAFMENGSRTRDSGEPIERLERKLAAYTAGWFPPKTPLNRQRCAILTQCLEQGDLQKPGLFTLTVPTGGGKTVASLAFALRHARTCGLRRVVYVLPYTSIIEQNAKIFRDILGTENVLEHHSGVLYDIQQEADPAAVRLAKATENWDMPVIVTTAVQFFESLYANRSSQCRKLHSLARSVLIFDEAQMLPLPQLRPCVSAIAQLVGHYGASAVLCTATQPALDAVFQDFLPETPPVELCPPGTFLPDLFRRVTFYSAGTLSLPTLTAQLNARPQALCIVNSRKSAQAIYALLDGDGCFHLSTLLCPAHRKAMLEEIRHRLNFGLPCRVVSTSLIEAGVDVDFPAVYREEAGLDSILQAAGRCNREGKRAPAESPVTVFRGEDQPPLLLRVPIAAARAAMSRFSAWDSSEAIACYFSELRDLIGKERLDKDGVLSMTENPLCSLPFAQVSEKFRLIEANTRTVYIPWKNGASLTARLSGGEHSRRLFRQLGQYSVNIYPNHFTALEQAGALRLLEDGSAILTDMTFYSEETGLALDIKQGSCFFI